MASKWPFVGRMDELARAEKIFAADTGLLLLGEAGIGKTALARHLAERAAGEGAAVIHVAGRAVSSGAPFEAFAAMLTGELPAVPGGKPMAAGGTAGRAAGAIANAMPGEVTSGQQATAAEVAARVAASAAGHRLMVVVDDVDLFDDGSGRVLLHLANAGAVIVATARSAPLPTVIESLWRDGSCERMDLAGLGDDEAAELLETLLGAPAGPAASAVFIQRAQGNPLLLRELVQAAVQRGALVQRGAIWALEGQPPLSGGIRDLVAARLAATGEAERVAMETVAAGEPLPVDVAMAMVGERQLIALEEARLVTLRAGMAGAEVAAAHPLYGEVLRADMPTLRLRRLRLALAGALETAERPSPHDLVRAASWRLDSGQGDDPERLLAAARAARGISLGTAERLARHAHETHRSLSATLLLAEILTNTGRGADAAALLGGLPPDSLTPSDREALIYCAAVGLGLQSGDTSAGTDLVAVLATGDPSASSYLHALHASMLAFDARLQDGLAIGLPLMLDERLPPQTRTIAAIGAIGAEYWLGRTRDAVAHADLLAGAATSQAARQALPYGAASIELLAICSLIDQGDLGDAEERSQRMRRAAAVTRDPFAGPRAEYCFGRVALARGRGKTAVRQFRRCLAGVSPFDNFIIRHLNAMLARAVAMVGELDTATAALEAGAGKPRMKPYEPEWDLAEAAVLAAGLRMDEAADRAAWAAGVAADYQEWNVVLAGYHDVARYGAPQQALAPLREAAARVDGALATCYVDHVAALADYDAAALDVVAGRFHALGLILFAAEAAAAAALAHAADGDLRAARLSGQRSADYRAACEGAVSPWLTGALTAAPLTPRERQIAALAADGHADRAIAERLHISARTVQTHLAHVYVKLGITRRTDLADHLQ
jgi:DNA-binding NarL/FixJ family response regulator